MVNGYRILDADCHVLEPDEAWTEGLSAEFKDRAPHFVKDESDSDVAEDVERFGWRGLESARFKYVIDGHDVHHCVPPVLLGEISRKTDELMPNPKKRGLPASDMLIALERMGVDVAFLYPTVALHLLAIDEMNPALAVELAHAYNTWMAGYCAEAPRVLQPVGVVCRHDPRAMTDELIRVANMGWHGVHLRPNPVSGRRLSDPDYEDFWTECERRKISVGIHEASHARTATAGADRFSSRFALHACSHPMEQMMAFLDLVEGGVLERHPDLNVAFFEAGAGWLPYWLWRLDGEFEDLDWEVGKNVRALPSEYFKRQCYIAIEPTEPGLPEVIRTIGADRLLLGSDYPHMDHDREVIAKTVALESELGSDTVRKILWDNPCHFYRWSPAVNAAT